jgi:hypothetical protein
MNILFVMKHRGNAGNTHAVANYMRVAPRHGHNVAMYGEPLSHLPDLKFSTDVHAFDRVAFLFESELYRLKPLQEVALLGNIRKRHRLIFDMDGMYNPLVRLDGYDFNHRSEAERARWIAFYDALGGQVAKPTLACPDNSGAQAMIFYGYDPALQIDASSAPRKQFDILHVGHNWWRWKQIGSELLPAIQQIRGEIGEIGFIGLWWDQPPAEGSAAGPQAAFESDPEALRRLRIQTGAAVMYTDVIRTMSTARINIFTQRPVLHHLRHLTLKYFEIFYADTIPLLMLDADHAVSVYGPAARELVLRDRAAAKILDALHRPQHYKAVVDDVRGHLAAHYSYDRRVEELVAAMQDRC